MWRQSTIIRGVFFPVRADLCRRGGCDGHLEKTISMLFSLWKSMRQRPSVRRGGERRLHIGGVEAKPGWEILNAMALPTTDHVGSAADLTCFPDECFVEVYGSHVLEHLDFKDELQSALREWFRVLAKGGRLYVGVPDLDALARLVLDPKLSLNDRFHVVKVMFGGHVDEYDYHKVGFNFEILRYFLTEAGFTGIERVHSFGLFNDTSSLTFAETPISLNVIAFKPE